MCLFCCGSHRFTTEANIVLYVRDGFLQQQEVNLLLHSSKHPICLSVRQAASCLHQQAPRLVKAAAFVVNNVPDVSLKFIEHPLNGLEVGRVRGKADVERSVFLQEIVTQLIMNASIVKKQHTVRGLQVPQVVRRVRSHVRAVQQVLQEHAPIVTVLSGAQHDGLHQKHAVGSAHGHRRPGARDNARVPVQRQARLLAQRPPVHSVGVVA